VPFSTPFTSAPAGLPRPNESASSFETSWITTPIRPRLTRPTLRSWPEMSIATSIGIANDSPMNPPVRL